MPVREMTQEEAERIYGNGWIVWRPAPEPKRSTTETTDVAPPENHDAKETDHD